MKKNIKLTGVFIALLFTCNGIFAQIQLPISGTYTIASESIADKVEIIDQKISVMKEGNVLQRFFIVGKDDEFYTMEQVQPNAEVVSSDPKRDKKIVRVKVNSISDNECHLVLFHPNGKTESIHLTK